MRRTNIEIKNIDEILLMISGAMYTAPEIIRLNHFNLVSDFFIGLPPYAH